MNVPLLNQRRRWYAFWLIVAQMIAMWACSPEYVTAGTTLFVTTLLTGTVLAYWPRPEDPFA
jgi:paraquat-inducible protein B